jgi:hypothetical protein
LQLAEARDFGACAGEAILVVGGFLQFGEALLGALQPMMRMHALF